MFCEAVLMDAPSSFCYSTGNLQDVPVSLPHLLPKDCLMYQDFLCNCPAQSLVPVQLQRSKLFYSQKESNGLVQTH